MSGFESWFNGVKEDVIEVCDNNMDEFQAEYWMSYAFSEGWNMSNRYSGRSVKDDIK